MDGELVLVMAQGEFAADVEGLVENDVAVVFLSYADLLAKEFQSAEHGALLIAHVCHLFGVDDIHTAKTAHQDQTVVGTGDGALVVGTLLQTVLAAETAHEERPLAILLLLGNDVRDAVFCHHPHRVEFVFGDAYDTRAEES